MAVIELRSYQTPHRIGAFPRSVERSPLAALPPQFVSNRHQDVGWAALLERFIQRWRRRRALRRELLPEPDSVLADAGFTRAEAEREASKPFWRD